MTQTTQQWLNTLPVSRQQEMLSLHEAFWKRENKKPLIGFAPNSRMFPLQNLNINHQGRFTPEDITKTVIAADTTYRPGILPEDDLFPAKIPLEPLAWSEGYIGANVYLSSTAQTVWSEPNDKLPQSIEDLAAIGQHQWREKLAQATQTNVTAAQNDLLISEALLRGPADCLEAVIGAETLCYALYDRPHAIADMANFIADRLIELYQAQFDVMGRFHGGTVNRYRLWAPGKNIVTQADFANVMSAEHFSNIFAPCYRRLTQPFDKATIHFHSSACQHVDTLLNIDKLDAIEWALDPTGPNLDAMVRIFEKIQSENKCVIVMNLETEEQVQLLENRLNPAGLCLIVRKSF